MLNFSVERKSLFQVERNGWPMANDDAASFFRFRGFLSSFPFVDFFGTLSASFLRSPSPLSPRRRRPRRRRSPLFPPVDTISWEIPRRGSIKSDATNVRKQRGTSISGKSCPRVVRIFEIRGSEETGSQPRADRSREGTSSFSFDFK